MLAEEARRRRYVARPPMNWQGPDRNRNAMNERNPYKPTDVLNGKSKETLVANDRAKYLCFVVCCIAFVVSDFALLLWLPNLTLPRFGRSIFSIEEVLENYAIGFLLLGPAVCYCILRFAALQKATLPIVVTAVIFSGLGALNFFVASLLQYAG